MATLRATGICSSAAAKQASFEVAAPFTLSITRAPPASNFGLPRPGPTPRIGSPRPDAGANHTALADAGHVHSAQFLLEHGDLVADPRGQLELQLPSGPEHLVVEILDQRRQLGPRHAGPRRRRAARVGRTLGRAALAAAAGFRHRRLAPAHLPAAADDRPTRAVPELTGRVLRLAVDVVEDVGDLLAQRLRVDAPLLVVSHLL